MSATAKGEAAPVEEAAAAAPEEAEAAPDRAAEAAEEADPLEGSVVFRISACALPSAQEGFKLTRRQR